jgi:hypothetical protein
VKGYYGLCYRVAGWLNCFINGCWILVVACMVLASRRAPKGALIVSLSLLVMILPEDLLKEACFCQILWAILIAHNRCIKCKKEKNGASPFNEGRRMLATLMG